MKTSLVLFTAILGFGSSALAEGAGQTCQAQPNTQASGTTTICQPVAQTQPSPNSLSSIEPASGGATQRTVLIPTGVDYDSAKFHYDANGNVMLYGDY